MKVSQPVGTLLNFLNKNNQRFKIKNELNSFLPSGVGV